MNGEGLGGGDCGGGVEGGAKKKEHGKEQPGHFDGGWFLILGAVANMS